MYTLEDFPLAQHKGLPPFGRSQVTQYFNHSIRISWLAFEIIYPVAFVKVPPSGLLLHRGIPGHMFLN